MYDYSTGEANPAVIVNLMRGAHTQLKWFNQQMFNHQSALTNPIKFNKNEIKALREFLVWGLCLALLSIGWMAFHRNVQEETKDLKPKTYEESLPSIKTLQTKKSILDLQINVYLELSTLNFRHIIFISLQLWLSPQQL